MKSTKKLETVKIPVAAVRVARERLAPLHLRFWESRGYMSMEDALLNAYIQGFDDALQVEAKFTKLRAL